MVDQQRIDMIGAYGHDIVKTPNIDSLRNDGILFSNAFTKVKAAFFGGGKGNGFA